MLCSTAGINLISAQDISAETSDTHWSKAYEGIIPYGDVYKVCVDEMYAYSAPEYHPKYLIPAPRGLRWGTVLAGGRNAGTKMVGFTEKDGNKVYYPRVQLCVLNANELKEYIEQQTLNATFINQEKNIAPVPIKTNRWTLFEKEVAKGVYSVSSKGIKLFKSPNRDADTIPSNYAPGDVIMNVENLENNWVSIDDGMGKGGKIYMHRSQLQYVPVKELRERLGSDVVIEVNDDPNMIFGFSVFRGWKAGKYGLWVVIIALGLLLLFDLILLIYNATKEDDEILWKLVRFHGFGLAIVSLLEIWYFTTLGMKQMSWFLKPEESGDYVIWNYIIFIIVSAIQVAALYFYLYGIQNSRSFTAKPAWSLAGLLFALVLYIPAIQVYHMGPAGETIFGLSHEWYILLCVIIGQLPQVLNINTSYRKQVPSSLRTPMRWEMLLYLLASAGTICIALMSTVILVAVIFFYVFAFLLLKEGLKGAVNATFGGTSGTSSGNDSNKPLFHCCASCARNHNGVCAEYNKTVSDPLAETNCGQFRF